MFETHFRLFASPQLYCSLRNSKQVGVEQNNVHFWWLSTRDNQYIFACTIEHAAEMEVPHELEGMGGMPVANNSSTHVFKTPNKGEQNRCEIRI